MIGAVTGDPLTLSFWISGLIGGTHAMLAVLCLLMGPFIFRRRKGDKIHKLMGRLWASMMLVLNVTALLTYDLHGRPNLFHFFAVVNLCALIPAIWFIRKFGKTRNPKDLAQHQEYMAWAYFGLAAAGFWQMVTTLMRFDLLPLHPKYFLPAMGILTGVACWGVARYLSRRAAPSRSNEHKYRGRDG